MEKSGKSLNFGDLFTESFNEFTSKFRIIGKTFLFLYLIPLVVLVVLLVLILIVTFPFINISGNAVSDLAGGGTNLLFNGSSDFPVTGFALIIIVGFFVLVNVVLNFLLSIAYIQIGFKDSQEMTFGEIFNYTKGWFWKYVGLMVVMGLILSLPVAILVGIAILLIYLLSGSLFGQILVGSIFGVSGLVYIIIFGIFWIFSTYVLIDQNKGIRESLSESKRIVKGQWWRVFGYVLLVGIISSVVVTILGWIPLIGTLATTLILSPFITIFMKNFYLVLKNGSGKG